jgi:L-seryl-tRNA(Ser) seleniumtransferase
MTLAGLEGTLIDYLKGENGRKNIPVYRDMLATKEEIKGRVEKMMKGISEYSSKYHISLREDYSQVGGGTMPEVQLPTILLSLKHKELSSATLAKKLRVDSNPAIITRIQNDELLVDLRTVEPEEEEFIIKALADVK